MNPSCKKAFEAKPKPSRLREFLNLAEACRYRFLYRKRLKGFNSTTGFKKCRLNSQEKTEIRSFWRKYGLKQLNLDWFQLYKQLTGCADPDFIPEEIFRVHLEKRFNNIEYASRYSDKNSLDHYFEEFSRPETVLRKIHGRFYDEIYLTLSLSEALSLLKANPGHFVVKPTIDTGSGKSVNLIEIKKSGEIFVDGRLTSLAEIDDFYGKDFVVQKRVEQSSDLSAYHKKSLNTLRIITIRIRDQFAVVAATFRMGNGAFVDNGHSGGLLCGVDVGNGNLTHFAYDVEFQKYYEHPISKLSFKGRSIPNFSEIKKMAVSAHSQMLYASVVSFDICLDSKNRPMLIEVNTKGQGIEPHQILKGSPIFGQYTAEFFGTELR